MLFTVLGLPKAAWGGGLGHWVSAVLAGHDITAPAGLQGAAGTCTMALLAYFQGLALGCPAHGGGGAPGLFAMMQTAVHDKAMSAEEVQTTALNLSIAGYLSTTFLLATGTYNLLTHRIDWNGCARTHRWQGQRWRGAALRRAGATRRSLCRRRMLLGGVQLRKGDAVTLVLGSANPR